MKLTKQHSFLQKKPSLPWLIMLLIAIILLFIPLTALAEPGEDGLEPVFGGDLHTAPTWLAEPVNTMQVYSQFPLAGLAGHLINAGAVDASGCTNGAYLEGGSANECGMAAAEIQTLTWQNRFNSAILAASQETGVPPLVLKSIFAWESQFWPNTIYVNTYEYGFGHITEAGADSALRWNSAFYQSVCKTSLGEETCGTRYADQPQPIRAALMGVVVQQVVADCANCPYGLDLTKAEKSIPVFAHTLLANANLVKMTVRNLTGKTAIEAVSYENLWKFSLASYNAGPGCFVSAFSRTYHNYRDLSWKNFSAQLDPACRGAVKYVDFISNIENYHPENDPDLAQSPTAEVTPTEMATEVPSDLPSEVPTEIPGSEVTSTPTPEITTDTPQPTQAESETPTPEDTATVVVPTERTPEPTADPTSSETPTAEIPQQVVEQLEAPHVPDELIVQIDPLQRQQVLNTLQGMGINLVEDGENIPSLDTLVLQVTEDQLAGVLSTLQDNGGVVFAEPNYLAGLASLPNDPEIAAQPNLWNIQAPEAWNALPSLQEVLVAVLDTGIDGNHPDLTNVVWQNAGEVGLDGNGNDRRSNSRDDDGNGYIDDWQGWNMISGTNAPADDQGHGTHISGIIGASVNNAVGIAGVAPNARILPVKVLDANGYGTYAQVAEGIHYAVDMGARVINLGFAGLGSSQMLQEAVDYANANGVLVVAAAGNGGMNSTYYPAAYPGVMAVGAVDSVLNWSPFSSSGEHISLVAPGVGIYSTAPGGAYRNLSGTSQAGAHVAGVAAMLAGIPHFQNYDDLRSALLGSAFDLGAPGKDPYFGYGILHAFDALGYNGPVMPTPTPWVVPSSTPGGDQGLYQQAMQELWGLTQTTSYAITNPSNSIDNAINDLFASSTGPYGGSSGRRWTFTSIDNTTFTSVAQVYLDFRMYMDGWQNDTFYIQLYEPNNPACLFDWCTVFTLAYTPANELQARVPTTPTTISVDVTNLLNTASKVNNAQFRLTGSAVTGGVTDNVTIYFDEIRLRPLDVLPPTPTPTATPVFLPTVTLPPQRAITATPQSDEPHNNLQSPSTDFCASCHRSHSAQSMSLRSQTGEEQVCFACHNSDGIGTSLQNVFTNETNTRTRFFSHGVGSYLHLHLPDEITGGNFAGSLRHVECEDCHQPHASSRVQESASNAAPAVQQEMYLSSGVEPHWEAAGAASNFTWLATAEKEFQVCFKCHSSFTSLPEYVPDGYGWNGSSGSIGFIPNGLAKLTSSNPLQILDNRDLAKEFNSYQLSYHPVAAEGRNTLIPPGSFVPGWSITSIVYCTDCHENANAPINGNGPHGSPNLHILAGSSEYITQTDPSVSCAPSGCPNIHPSGELCFKCHQYGTYASGGVPAETTRFRRSTDFGPQNLHAFHSFASCYTCHDTHGSEQERLINFDTTVVTIPQGSNSQAAWSFNYSTGVGSCGLICHDGDHYGPDFEYNP